MEHIFSAFGSVSAADQLPGTYLAKLLEEMAESGLNSAKYLEMAGMKSISEQVFWDEVPYQDYLNFVEAVLTADIPALAFRTGLKFSIWIKGW